MSTVCDVGRTACRTRRALRYSVQPDLAPILLYRACCKAFPWLGFHSLSLPLQTDARYRATETSSRCFYLCRVTSSSSSRYRPPDSPTLPWLPLCRQVTYLYGFG